MENKKLVLCGAGGHAKSIYSSLKELNNFKIIGYCDNEKKEFFDLKYLGNDNEILKLKKDGINNIFVCIGSIGNPKIRKKLYLKMKENGFSMPSIIDRTAVVDARMIGSNVFIGKNSVVNSNASIGDMAIINSGSVIEHDTIIENFVHIAPGVVICGNCKVGENSHIGAGSVVIQGITIGKDCIIGAGSVVVKDIPDGVVAFGNPCRVVRKNEKSSDNS